MSVKIGFISKGIGSPTQLTFSALGARAGFRAGAEEGPA